MRYFCPNHKYFCCVPHLSQRGAYCFLPVSTLEYSRAWSRAAVLRKLRLDLTLRHTM